MKAIRLELSEALHGKIKGYAEDREIPLVGAIRLILSEFFRNKSTYMSKNEGLPPGVMDMGPGKGLAIDMEQMRDENGVTHVPPTKLSKEETIEWIWNFHNSKTSKSSL